MHTQRKWEIQKTTYKGEFIILQEEQIKSIASVSIKANAQLIASAPEMLEACKTMLGGIEESLIGIDEPDSNISNMLKGSEWEEEHKILQQAINKAEGK